MKKKLIIGICVLVVIVALASQRGTDDEKSNDNQTPATENVVDNTSKESASKATEEPKKEEKYSTSLTAGQYISGIDFPSGTYNIKVKSGNGNVSSSNMYSGGLNQIMSLEDDGISIKDFRNAKFPEGVVLSISSNLKIEISTDAADVSGMKKRENKNAKEVTLKSGNYVSGKDFNVGTYDIVAVKGSGNVSSSNLFDGGLNEIMGIKKDGFSIKKYKNAIFDEDVELSISGVQVKLIPSK